MPPLLALRAQNPLTNMPTHALPLTRAHGPDTRSASTALSRRFGVPFPFPSANHLPPSFLRESQLRPLSVSAHDGLTFASSVSRYEVMTRTLAQRSGRLSRKIFTRRKSLWGRNRNRASKHLPLGEVGGYRFRCERHRSPKRLPYRRSHSHAQLPVAPLPW